jgi:hypothetical protein
MSETYTIMRFFRETGKSPRVIARGITLEEAKKHCSDGRTHSMKHGWFDGYTREGA